MCICVCGCVNVRVGVVESERKTEKILLISSILFQSVEMYTLCTFNVAHLPLNNCYKICIVNIVFYLFPKDLLQSSSDLMTDCLSLLVLCSLCCASCLLCMCVVVCPLSCFVCMLSQHLQPMPDMCCFPTKPVSHSLLSFSVVFMIITVAILL